MASNMPVTSPAPPSTPRFPWQAFYAARAVVRRRFNRYNDVEIEAASLYHETTDWFIYEVQMERQAWETRNEDMNLDPVVLKNACFWISLPVNMAFYLSYLLQIGFTVHHATAARFVLVIRNSAISNALALLSTNANLQTPSIDTLTSTTSTISPCASNATVTNRDRVLPVPEYGTHYCRIECIVIHRAMHVDQTGAGGFVRPYVLMVRERIGKICTKDPVGEIYAKSWKFVSGSVNSGEFFSDAAAREVLEETGINALFVGVVGVANRLQTRFLRDEITLCCLMMTPDVSDPPPVAKSEEIQDAAWIPLECVHVTLSNNTSTYAHLAYGWLCSAIPKIKQLGIDCAEAPPSVMAEMRVVDHATKKEARNYLFL